MFTCPEPRNPARALQPVGVTRGHFGEPAKHMRCKRDPSRGQEHWRRSPTLRRRAFNQSTSLEGQQPCLWLHHGIPSQAEPRTMPSSKALNEPAGAAILVQGFHVVRLPKNETLASCSTATAMVSVLVSFGWRPLGRAHWRCNASRSRRLLRGSVGS